MLTWLIKEDELIVWDKYQATLYAAWAQPRTAFLTKMRNELLTLEGDQTWADVLSLACKYGVYGMGTRKPLVFIEES